MGLNLLKRLCINNVLNYSVIFQVYLLIMDVIDSAEGFICPHCLVNFASSSKLQHHFLEFHSESGEQEQEEAEVYRRMDGLDDEVRNSK